VKVHRFVLAFASEHAKAEGRVFEFQPRRLALFRVEELEALAVTISSLV
jgi:hypothetical protein